LAKIFFVAMVNVLPLDSPRWNELTHAYGSAEDIPALLLQLESFPESNDYRDEPWFSLWSALAHQGDVYSASFAAVPHVVRILDGHPSRATYDFFLFPSAVEIGRQKKSIPIPTDLEADYLNSLSRFHALAVEAFDQTKDVTFQRSVLSAIAASEGNIELAETILDDDPE